MSAHLFFAHAAHINPTLERLLCGSKLHSRVTKLAAVLRVEAATRNPDRSDAALPTRDIAAHQKTPCPNIKGRIERLENATAVSGIKQRWLALGCTQTTKNHSRCDGRICRANDLATLRAIKPQESCHRDDHQTRADGDLLCDLIEDSKIPVLSISPDGSSLSIEEFSSQTPVVAISHALADGLWNLQDTSLPITELQRISSYVSNLSHTHIGDEPPARIWIDTLCVPPRLLGRAGVSDTAFEIMDCIILGASAVLVVDSDIRSLRKDCAYAEAFIKITFSSWGSRLWTLYEAILARKLFFQCQDGVLSLGDLSRKFQRQGSDYTGSPEHLVYLPELPYAELRAFARPVEKPSVVGFDQFHRLLESTLIGRRTSLQDDERFILDRLRNIPILAPQNKIQE